MWCWVLSCMNGVWLLWTHYYRHCGKIKWQNTLLIWLDLLKRDNIHCCMHIHVQRTGNFDIVVIVMNPIWINSQCTSELNHCIFECTGKWGDRKHEMEMGWALTWQSQGHLVSSIWESEKVCDSWHAPHGRRLTKWGRLGLFKIEKYWEEIK